MSIYALLYHYTKLHEITRKLHEIFLYYTTRNDPRLFSCFYYTTRNEGRSWSDNTETTLFSCLDTDTKTRFRYLCPEPLGVGGNIIKIFKFQCSRTCDGGLRHRVVVCHNNAGDLSLECDLNRMPPTEISCNSEPCPRWNFGAWAEVRP